MPIPSLTTVRRTVAALLVAAVVGLLLLPTPAQAVTWHTINSTHGGKLQVCGEPTNGKVRVRVRVDNRQASHVHLGGISAQGQSRNLRARPGQLTNAASLVVGRYVKVSAGIGETNGQGSGDVLPAATFPRC